MKTKMTAIHHNAALGVAALLLGLHVGTAQAATLFTNNDPGNSYIGDADNWDNGLPTGGSNPGTVPTGFSTTYNAYFNNYDITFNGTSSASGSTYLGVIGGASVTFNDDAVLTASGDRSFLGGGTSASSLTFNDNASGSVGGTYLWFGTHLEPGGMNLSLTGNSSFSINVSSQITKNSPGAPYIVNLADSAVWETVAPIIALSGVTVNFQQTPGVITPTWKIPETKSFSSISLGTIQYQINGVNTTLADERFVITEGVGGFDTLSLTLIPEPSTLTLLVGGLGILRALRRRKGNYPSIHLPSKFFTA